MKKIRMKVENGWKKTKRIEIKKVENKEGGAKDHDYNDGFQR